MNCLFHSVQGVFSGQYFPIFEIIIFCFVVVICDQVHDVDAIHGL